MLDVARGTWPDNYSGPGAVSTDSRLFTVFTPFTWLRWFAFENMVLQLLSLQLAFGSLVFLFYQFTEILSQYLTRRSGS